MTQRRLAAILAADMVGYSAMMERDEVGTVARLKADREQFIDPAIDSHSGRIVRMAGDGALVEFPSVVEAAQCSIDIQRGMAERNADRRENEHIVFRMGVNLGDIIVEDDNLHGEGINVAARLESLCEPGGVLLSEEAARYVEGKIDAAVEFVEERAVKNIERPVRIWQVTLNQSPGQASAAARRRRKLPLTLLTSVGVVLVVLFAVALWHERWAPVDGRAETETITSDRPSIAVLPFSNLNGDPEQEYFADGITADLITDLSRLSGLMVIARNSSFSYKGRAVNVREVGHELGVRYVLEGSVQRAGQQVRINAQLVDARSGLDMWADRYDRDLTNVLVLQDEVTRKIVQELQVQLTPAEENSLHRERAVNAEAYDLLLRGNEFHHRFTREDNLRSREYYEQAITVDPNFARAYANLALSYANAIELDWTDDVEGAIQKALELSETALALDQLLPQVHFARSTLFLAMRQHQAAISAARRSIDVDPNYADGHGMLAHTLAYAGEHEAALEALETAKRLNPQVSYIYRWIEARAMFMLGASDEALALAREVVERNPVFLDGRLLLASILGYVGEIDGAVWQLEEALQLRPNVLSAGEGTRALYKRATDRDRYMEGLKKAGLAELSAAPN